MAIGINVKEKRDNWGIAHLSPGRTSIPLPGFQECLKDWMVFFSNTLEIGGCSLSFCFWLSVCLCQSLSPSFLFSLPLLSQTYIVACASISSVYLTCRHVLLSKPTYSSYLWEQIASWGRGSSQIFFVAYLNCPCGFSWLLEMMSGQ